MPKSRRAGGKPPTTPEEWHGLLHQVWGYSDNAPDVATLPAPQEPPLAD